MVGDINISIEDVVDDIISDIEECLEVSEDDGKCIEDIIRIFWNNSEESTQEFMNDCLWDDVRYCPYKHNEYGVISICIQDFDFDDYDKDGFFVKEGLEADELNILQFYRCDLEFIQGRHITECDELADTICGYVVKNIINKEIV